LADSIIYLLREPLIESNKECREIKKSILYVYI
jgi:hypothetical protein